MVNHQKKSLVLISLLSDQPNQIAKLFLYSNLTTALKWLWKLHSVISLLFLKSYTVAITTKNNNPTFLAAQLSQLFETVKNYVCIYSFEMKENQPANAHDKQIV